MNFSIFSNQTGPGTIEPDGSTTGLFKLVHDRDIDGTTINYVITHDRLDVFDSIFPALISETLMFINLETELNWSSYLAPFSLKVWISITVWITLATTISYIIKRSKKIQQSTIIHSFFDIMQALCYQAGKVSISNPALYISYLMPYLLAIILVQYYSGRLLSNLTVKNVIVPFENLYEVIEDGRYKVIAVRNAFAETYFQKNKGYEPTALRERGLLEPSDQMPANTAEGFHKLCQGKYVYVCASAIDYNVQEEDCHIAQLKAVISYESWGILVWKGFPYKNDMTRLMRQIQFSGLVKLIQNNIVIPKDDAIHFQPLSLQQIFPIFLFYFFVIVICGFILSCEILLNHIRKNFKMEAFKYK